MRKLLICVACALALGLTATPASATTALSWADAYYVGVIVPSVPSSLADESGYINALLLLNGQTTGSIGVQTLSTMSAQACLGTNDCPATSGSDALKNDSENNAVNTEGWLYVLAKYDNDKGGGLVWYLGGTVDSVTVPQHYGTCGNGPGCGLSHTSLFSQVPDGGTTAGLLGLAMLGIGYLRRRLA